MKQIFALLILALACVAVHGQMIGGDATVVTVYSQNERFYLKSIPFDDESPSLRGKTLVYERGSETPLYTLDRGFDIIQPNTLILSNDGQTIFLATTWGADEEKDGMKSISVYRHGKLIRSFTELEVTGCDKNKERCQLVYNNDKGVIDYAKTFASDRPGKIFKAGVDEQEQFLNEFPIFSADDFVYLTDSKKVLHTFHLNEARFIRAESFSDSFEQIRTKARATRVTEKSYRAPRFEDFPNLKDGNNTNAVLANYLGMKAGGLYERDRYKTYTVVLSGNLLRDGSLEIESIEIDPELPKERILEFFKTNRFDSRALPAPCDKWYLRDEFLYLRNANIRQAILEKQQERRQQDREFQRRLTLETINGVYIPANLGECFVELDKKLSEIDRKEMRALDKGERMVLYHDSLGMWMRNNWGLWGGSRLQKYFRDRGVNHPDDMSGVILRYYYDWLNDKKDTWKTWEQAKKPQP